MKVLSSSLPTPFYMRFLSINFHNVNRKALNQVQVPSKWDALCNCTSCILMKPSLVVIFLGLYTLFETVMEAIDTCIHSYTPAHTILNTVSGVL